MREIAFRKIILPYTGMLLGFAIRTSRRDSRNASNSIFGHHNHRCSRTARCSCIPSNAKVFLLRRLKYIFKIIPFRILLYFK